MKKTNWIKSQVFYSAAQVSLAKAPRQSNHSNLIPNPRLPTLPEIEPELAKYMSCVWRPAIFAQLDDVAEMAKAALKKDG